MAETTKRPDVKYLFEPRGVAVIGASHTKGKIGYKIVENLTSTGFDGGIYPVNPKGGEILGTKVYTSLDEVEGPVDIACIAIPAKYIMDAAEQCASKGVKFMVVITSGFSEVGNIAEEKALVKYANDHGMRVLGPNIFGLYYTPGNLNASFGPTDVAKGNVAIITQSGAIGSAMIGKTRVENIGLSAMISVGNKSDIDETDLLEYMVNDKNTKIIFMYIEGVKRGDLSLIHI